MKETSVSTIGFTQTTAQHFFARLLRANVKKVIDVRLNNTSQLSAFAKSGDLSFFLLKIGGIGYDHEPMLAPTQDILTEYKKMKGDWNAYATLFMELMAKRKIESQFKAEYFDGACLLCSEATPHHCHRRLICDYLNSRWGGNLRVKHL